MSPFRPLSPEEQEALRPDWRKAVAAHQCAAPELVWSAWCGCTSTPWWVWICAGCGTRGEEWSEERPPCDQVRFVQVMRDWGSVFATAVLDYGKRSTWGS